MISDIHKHRKSQIVVCHVRGCGLEGLIQARSYVMTLDSVRLGTFIYILDSATCNIRLKASEADAGCSTSDITKIDIIKSCSSMVGVSKVVEKISSSRCERPKWQGYGMHPPIRVVDKYSEGRLRAARFYRIGDNGRGAENNLGSLHIECSTASCEQGPRSHLY